MNLKKETARKEEDRKKALCAFVRKELEKRSRERMPFELQWQLNMNFLLGNQYCDILPQAGQLYQQDKAFPWQEREVYNHIAPIVESRLAKLNKICPRLSVRPATGDEEDVRAAQVSTAILHSAYERMGMPAILGEAASWSETCGTVFYRQDWAGNKGQMVGTRPDGTSIREGDVTTVVCPPYEIYPDSPYHRTISECGSVIHARVFPVTEIREKWGKDVKSEKVRTFGMEETTVTGGFGARAAVPGVSETIPEDSALVTEYFEMPTKAYPEGRYLAVCGSELLSEGGLPYRTGENDTPALPFVQQVCIVRPGCLWGVSAIERCIPVQRAYNAVRNRKHEFLNRAAVGVLAVEEGAVDIDELEENGLTPGKVLVYRQGAAVPQMLPSGSLPDEFRQEEISLLSEFDLISGTSELMRRSAAPTNVTSGTALNIIQEQDDTRLAITADKIRDAVLDISRQWLHLYRQFAGEMRLARIVGENGRVDRLFWSAALLTSDDVVHETENELSDSLANRRQMIYDLLARGVFSRGTMDERTRNRMLQALGAGDWENINDLARVHTARAQRENMLLEKGGEARVMDADDHAVHLAEHARRMLSEEFEEHYGTDGPVHRAMEAHIREHKMKQEEQNGQDGTTC